ncbi:hypothetical protein AUJ44_03615 [Candidatus Nomurabacteria bacterium CG1_02_47_685]|uniref:Sodium/calcium exchanger membrane region domain-containing protein n=1 Tax=Candidatus Nomurabacteria bacterium CG1_02_47_685 TaxID=1805282 RepID=A0A1J4V415_9BACT|nr:MAG: hypothetical protein AUJ44_03615 [Candidatus Nomurabacteria bacterium CG1_02_47_685]
MNSMVIWWIIIFIISLAALVKGADLLLDSAEKIGVHFGLSPFVIGVLITGIGTSLPELASSIAAVMHGASEVVAANVVGSNIANILLVIGISAVVGRQIIVSKNLIDLELPLLAISTALFLGVAFDGFVSRGEATILILAYIVYLTYTLFSREPSESFVISKGKEIEEKLEKYQQRALYFFIKPFFVFKDYIFLIFGIILLLTGAQYAIEAVLTLSDIFGIAVGVISITAIAVGTSLPELLVSIRAARKKKYDISVGNILGSNAFNALMIIGIPGVAATLPLDEKTLLIGLPVMTVATLLFIISGISQKIHHWEGMLYIIFYIFFLMKLFT